MKLISCHVDNFGGLHNFDHNFDEGLNIVLEDNGWGKTTFAAFLKAMIYGFDSKRSKDITENERRRYLPWQGGKYGGYLVFEADGKQYRVERTFGETPRLDRAKIVDLASHMTARINPDELGEYLFHLDANAFQRSVFINQNGILMEGNAASSIHTRLNALVSQANDLAAYDGAVDELTQQIKIYEKTGNRGMLGDVSRSIAEKEKIRDQLAVDIQRQDTDRIRIAYIDKQLSELEKVLTEKKKALDKITGEAKKKEATQKMLGDLEQQMSPITEQLDQIRSELGGSIPDPDQLEEMKAKKDRITSLEEQLKALSKTEQRLKRELDSIQSEYNGPMPQMETLDEIQQVASELQGVQSADQTGMAVRKKPEGYDVINEAVHKDEAFLEKAGDAVEQETVIRESISKRDALNAEQKHIDEQWEARKKQYLALKAESEHSAEILKQMETLNPAVCEEQIEKLEQLRKDAQIIDLRREEQKKACLSDEEKLLDDATEDLPTAEEAEQILNRARDISHLKAESSAIQIRMDGERSRADGLKATVDQLQHAEDKVPTTVKEPNNTVNILLLIAGIILLGVSVFLWTQNQNTIMFAGMAAGAVMLILGIVGMSGYKGKVRAYEDYKTAIHDLEEKRKLKNDTQQKLDASLAALKDMTCGMKEKETEIGQAEGQVKDWITRYHGDASDLTEQNVRAITEKAAAIQRVREKKENLRKIEKELDAAEQNWQKEWNAVCENYPAVTEMDLTGALNYFRNAETAYKMRQTEAERVHGQMDKLVQEAGIAPEGNWPDQAESSVQIAREIENLTEKTKQTIQSVNSILTLIDVQINEDTYAQVLPKVRNQILEYRQYAQWESETGERARKQAKQVEELETRLHNLADQIKEIYPETELSQKIVLIRKDIQNIAKNQERKAEIDDQRKALETEIAELNDQILVFVIQYIASPDDKSFQMILNKTNQYHDLELNAEQIQKQKTKLEKNLAKTSSETVGEETTLRQAISDQEAQRDELLVEYTQKSEAIRQADQSLDRLPEIQQEIRTLYEEKQKMQNALTMLKRTIQLITKAKENLANRYLSKVETLFNSYMKIWLNDEKVRGILDIDFNIQIQEGNEAHVAEGYSTGYCDMIDFCMRLALVDTLFENEQPFLILDDPFVNLDSDRLDKALELLNVLSANKQIVYFVCHPIRAVEKEENTASRKKFAALAAAAKKTVAQKRTTKKVQKPIYVRASTKDLYNIKNEANVPVPMPVDVNAVITNSIFGMTFGFRPGESGRSGTYELFFIDEVGRVLNERQLLEVKDGKLSDDKVWFSLNTRDDSGETYELMIRETGQPDYEVLAKVPYKAKLSFSGTSLFDI